MSAITPTPVVEYLSSVRPWPHPELELIAAEGEAAGLPIVDPQTGALLHALTRAAGASRTLEIGTAIGFSGLWIASALSTGGRLITLERNPDRAATARGHFAKAGLADQVSVMVGDATRYLHKIAGPFDLIFQDGDKHQYEPMLDRLIDLLRRGGMLVTDNVLWNGEVIPGYIDTPIRDAGDTAAIAAYNQRLVRDARIFTAFLSVGDGVALSVKR